MSRSTSISDLESHLGYWLRFVSNHVSFAFARKLSEKDITVTEWVMLRMLYKKNPMPSTRLAEEMGMTRGAITKLANRLIVKDLISRNAHTQDGRIQLLGLTARGTRLVPVLAALADKNDIEFFGLLSIEDCHQLERILKTLIAKKELKNIPLE